MARAFVLGDDVDTDQLAPGHAMKLPPAAMARFCLEAIDPGFAAAVRPGDVVIGGRNFGCGSSREQAAGVLRELGVAAVLARSFARIFYRNAINLGLPAFIVPPGLAPGMAPGMAIADRAEIALDLEGSRLVDAASGRSYALTPLPPHLLAMIRDGGLIPHLKRRFAAREA